MDENKVHLERLKCGICNEKLPGEKWEDHAKWHKEYDGEEATEPIPIIDEPTESEVAQVGPKSVGDNEENARWIRTIDTFLDTYFGRRPQHGLRSPETKEQWNCD